MRVPPCGALPALVILSDNSSRMSVIAKISAEAAPRKTAHPGQPDADAHLPLWLVPRRAVTGRLDGTVSCTRIRQPAQPYPRPASQPRPAEPQRTPALLVHGHRAGDRIASPQGAHAFPGSRIVNSVYSPTWLSTVMLPPCCWVTMS